MPWPLFKSEEVDNWISLAQPREKPIVCCAWAWIVVSHDDIAESGLPIVEYMRERFAKLPIDVRDNGEIVCRRGHIVTVDSSDLKTSYVWSSGE